MSFPAPTVETPNCQQNWDYLSTRIYSGNGSPNGRIPGDVGSIYLRRDGGIGSTFYVKESGGSGTSGWTAK